MYADLDDAVKMDLNTINNYQDWPDSALIELKKRDELIKSQKILITKLKSKLSLYCKHEKSGEIDNEEYLLDRLFKFFSKIL